MKMNEPVVEFVPVDMDEIVTKVSRCYDEAQRSAMTICDCTDDIEGQIPGCIGDIV